MTTGPGHYNEYGLYIYGEDDLATPDAGFSDLLNMQAESLGPAVENMVAEDLSNDPTIVDAAEQAVSDAFATLIGARRCVYRENGEWIYDRTFGPLSTHFIVPDHDGSRVVRPTLFPAPSDTTTELNW